MDSEITQCRLLQLPPELRNKIYSFALVEDNAIMVSERSDITGDPPVWVPGLLATNRQVRTEATPIFYGENTFWSLTEWSVGNFLNQLGIERRPMVSAYRMQSLSLMAVYIGRPVTPKDAGRATRLYDRIGLNFGKSGLRRDTVVVPVAQEGVWVWKKLKDIDELEVVDDGEGWRVEWK